MPMRVKVNGVVGEVIEPCGKFNYGDIVEIIKIKISKFDFFKSKVCVSDGQTVYWMNMKSIKLMPAEDCSI
ncbi:hypothetical protein IAI10_11125 [Clostridium sp. 19966]|uniref:hypothetical protein n=1 Tax=Clostridium sp. 19966 TaxID=2768166 RepID=UPI0028DF7DD0|nr:hypothetical protein [Clostridium sp. 19966]MDT8717209.1 hypothetical protein [Clostridium sp. 19966]